MMSLEESQQELRKWKPALMAELQKQASAKKLPWSEVGNDFEYHQRLEGQVFAIVIGEGEITRFALKNKDGKTIGYVDTEKEATEAIGESKAHSFQEEKKDSRSMIIGAVIEEADVKSSPNRFVPYLISSEVVEFSEKFSRGRNGYPHHIQFAPRANGVPSFKSVVKRAICRFGCEEEEKPQVKQKQDKPIPSTSGKGYLISQIKGSDDVFLHIGTMKLTREKMEKIITILDSCD